MTDEYRTHQGHPGDLKRRYKLVGTDPVLGDNLYAEVLALEAGSIGGGGGGTAASVTLADGTTSTQLAAVSAAGAIKVDNSGVTQPVSGTFWQATQPVSGSVSVSNFPGSQAVTGTFWQATQPVSGTFWQVTQPVSIATMPSTPVTGTFWQATQPVSGTFFQATQPVSIASMPSTPVTGTFFQATQPVSIAGTVAISAASLPLPTGAATALEMTDGSQVAQTRAAILCATNTAATGVACTLTIPAVAAQFHYITLIEIQLYATGARTGGATPILVTTTNLPGSPVWDFDTGQAIGVTIRQSSNFGSSLRSSVVNTATTIVAPIATAGIWRITAYYYAAV